MGRTVLAFIVVALLLSGSGCRNRCNQSGCGLASLWGNSTIPAPGTYSLNIPGVANQNYYVPGTAPPAGPAANPGWNASGTPQPGANATQPNSVWNGTSYQVPMQQAGYNPTSYSIAAGNGVNPQPAPAQGGGTQWRLAGGTQIVSPDFNTTRIDERQDPTRLPVADASAVRAPGMWNQMPNATQLASASMPIMQNPGYSMPNAVNNSAPSGYTRWNVSPNTPNYQGGMQPPVVLAEASTRDLSRDPNYQAGWREQNPPNQGTFNR